MDDSTQKLAILLTLMAALAAAETLLPLRAAAPDRRRSANLLLTLLFFLMNLLLGAAVVGMALAADAHGHGALRAVFAAGAGGLVCAIVVLDFFGYAVHRLMHAVPALWRVHRVHHSDPHVDVTTAFRQHPLETVLRFFATTLPALALGVPAGAVALYRLLSGVNALLEHANLRVPARLDRVLSPLFVTPDLHKVHHSRERPQTDSNYGNILSLFDRAFGTLTPARPAPRRYGLDGLDGPDSQRTPALLALPFRGP